jgi:hypothetical protein
MASAGDGSGRYDVVVIGAGHAGEAAAELAGNLGYSVALVERDTFGGTVVTSGGAPTKTFREAAAYLVAWCACGLGGPTVRGNCSQPPSACPHHQHTWAQVLAWAGGSAVWIVVTFIGCLIRGRKDRPQPVPELPGATTRRKLTGPMIMFALIRAIVVAGTTALAVGLNLPHGVWMPIAALVAMKPGLDQTRLTAAQRLIGAVAAVLLRLISGWTPARRRSPQRLRSNLAGKANRVVAAMLCLPLLYLAAQARRGGRPDHGCWRGRRWFRPGRKLASRPVPRGFLRRADAQG